MQTLNKIIVIFLISCYLLEKMKVSNMDSKQINKKMKKVPPHLIPEIMDYIDYLINKYSTIPKNKDSFNFSWEGGLSDISDKYNSVDLQHKAMDWR